MDDQGKPLFRHDLARQMQFTPIELMRQELQRAKQQRWARRRRKSRRSNSALPPSSGSTAGARHPLSPILFRQMTKRNQRFGNKFQ